MKYEVGYIVACLENYEIMKHEYELTYMDLMKELSELDKNIISLGINYGERVQSSRISDTTYEMYARKEEKTRILQKRINNVSESLDSLDRIILVFKKLERLGRKYIGDEYINERTLKKVLHNMRELYTKIKGE